MSATDATSHEALLARARASADLDAYARHTRDVLIPELQRLAVPWHFFAWRRLCREVQRRNAYVESELAAARGSHG